MWVHKQTNKQTNAENVKQPQDWPGACKVHAWLVKWCTRSH